jgi:hypothetical protein
MIKKSLKTASNCFKQIQPAVFMANICRKEANTIQTAVSIAQTGKKRIQRDFTTTNNQSKRGVT